MGELGQCYRWLVKTDYRADQRTLWLVEWNQQVFLKRRPIEGVEWQVLGFLGQAAVDYAGYRSAQGLCRLRVEPMVRASRG